jgi:hypothetical protein
MNAFAIESGIIVTAKPSGSRDQRKIVYALNYGGELPYVDKTELILNQLIACKRLLQVEESELDQSVLRKEMSELRLALHLVS